MSDAANDTAEVQENGTPAWVVTFADLMSLLLCFFVLLLSFSEMDRQKYKELSGALAEAFGVQRKVPAWERPQGNNMMAVNFDQDMATRQQESPGMEVNLAERQKKREYTKYLLEREVEYRFKDKKDLIQVEAGEHEMVIRLMGESTFESGQSDIRPQMVPLLEKIAAIVDGTEGDVIIAGHTDNIPMRGGRYASNLELSMARAATVGDFFVRRGLIAPERISAMGFGKNRPLVSNDTAAGREKNRRVEIILADSLLPTGAYRKGGR